MAEPGVKVVASIVLGSNSQMTILWAKIVGFSAFSGITVFAYEEIAKHAEQGNSRAERRRLPQAPFESFGAAAANKGGETPRGAIAFKCRRT